MMVFFNSLVVLQDIYYFSKMIEKRLLLLNNVCF